MPTYEYECKACGHRFESFQSIKASPHRKCPECKKLALKRLIGMGAGIIFKGSGFYETDYKRTRSSGTSPSEKKEQKESPSSKTSEKSSDKGSNNGSSKD